MVSAAPHARSASGGLRFRETGFRSRRKMRRNHLPTVTMPSLTTFPGNGISGPEKNAQKRPADCNDPVSENEPSHGSPPIRGLSYTFRKSPVADDCVVVDAAWIELVSTSNSLLAGNLAGNFLKKGPPKAILASKTTTASIVYKQIP